MTGIGIVALAGIVVKNGIILIDFIELLRAGTAIPFRMAGATIEFTIPGVLDYEVAAMYSI